MKEKIRVWKIRQGSPNAEPATCGDEVESFDQASKILPQGVYTSFRTYRRTQVLHVDEHFRRLTEGAELLGHQANIDPLLIRACLRTILQGLAGEDFRMRLSVDLEDRVGDVYIMAEKLVTPSSMQYQRGVSVLTRPFQRENPRAKSTRFIQNSAGYRTLLSKEINEVLLFNPQEEILEGLSSNFYGVSRSILFTANEGILPGITRAVVLEEAQKLPIEICFTPVRLGEIGRLDEAFLTSASRAVLPVRQIDQTKLGAGEPGPVARRLNAAFQARIANELEEI